MPVGTTINIATVTATNRQLSLHLIEVVEKLHERFNSLEAAVADIQATINALNAAVEKEFADNATLKALYDEALAARDQAVLELEAAQADDTADDAAVAEAEAKLEELEVAVQDAVEQLGMNDLPEEVQVPAEEPAVVEPEPVAPVEEVPVTEPEPVLEEPAAPIEPEPVLEEPEPVYGGMTEEPAPAESFVPVEGTFVTETTTVESVPAEGLDVAPVAPATEYNSAFPPSVAPEEEVTENDEFYRAP